MKSSKVDAPFYPPIAKAARVQGVVISRLDFDLNGSVSKVEIVSGPALLVKSVETSEARWVFSSDASADGCQILVISEFSLSDSEAANDDKRPWPFTHRKYIDKGYARCFCPRWIHTIEATHADSRKAAFSKITTEIAENAPFFAHSTFQLGLLLRGSVRIGDNSPGTEKSASTFAVGLSEAKLEPCARSESATTLKYQNLTMNSRRWSPCESFTTFGITCFVC